MRNRWIGILINKCALIILLLFTACTQEYSSNTISDIDGNNYSVITIGDQVWMADNLRVTRYRNGDPIPIVTDDTAWSHLSSGAHCYYNNDTNNIDKYGRLYNWYVLNDSRGIAPEGWHMPTDEEIITLVNFLGGDTIAAGKLKEAGSSHWLIPGAIATSHSGFLARPGGYRFDKGSYHTMGSNGYWWSDTRSYEIYTWNPRLYTGFADVKREPYYEKYGFAIRCIKDQKPADRIAKEEQVVEGFDHSLNRISKSHYYFPDIDGSGLVVSIKEDLFDIADIDFKNRYLPVSLEAEKISAHATMMATLIGGGGNSFYKGTGVAKGSMLSSSSYKNLIADADAFYMNNNISVQNHSYGTDIENFYGADAASYDKNVFQQPKMVHVFSSGNSGASAGNAGTYKNIEGFANLTGSFKMSKNSIVVSAIDSFGNSMDYISKGPAYDGRLKPELSACTNGGSSGAAALVSGSALLVQHLYKKKFNQLPDAALVKAVLINAADDAGSKGIDFKTGYGSLNLFKALRSMQEERFFSGNLQHNGIQSFTIAVPDRTAKLKITLTWTDPPASANDPAALVNDLDLIIIQPGGQEWLPWVLSSFPQKDSLELAATRRQDHINTTEQICIDNPVAGNYEIRTSGYRVTGTQPFHIAWDYEEKDQFSWDYPVAIDNLLPSENNIIRWQNSFTENGTIEWTTNGSEWQTIHTRVDLSKNYIIWSVPDTVSAAQLRMKIGAQVFLSDIFTISRPISFELYSNCMDSVHLHWRKQKNVSSYKVFVQGSKYLEPLAITADTMISLPGTGLAPTYFSIAPILANGKQGIKAASMKHENRGTACADKAEYLVYPNPVSRDQQVNLASPGIINDVFQLYNIQGKMLLQQRLAGSNSSIFVKNVAKGVYFYIIINNGVRKHTGKLIIQ